MKKRGTITRIVETRSGRGKVAVRWDSLGGVNTIDPDALDYVIELTPAALVGRRVRRLPTKDVGKTSGMTDWAGAIGVVTTSLKDAYVTVVWPDGSDQRLSVFAIEDA